jgi:retron-type reverse transcriptase
MSIGDHDTAVGGMGKGINFCRRGAVCRQRPDERKLIAPLLTVLLPGPGDHLSPGCHVNVDTLWTAFYALKRKAAAGVDGVTWQDYEADLRRNLEDLHGRVHRGAYRPQPSRRTYIPKADGRQRPLAIAALEDKIVQGACVIVLNAIYEEDFLGFSYGFRPGRGPQDALDAS